MRTRLAICGAAAMVIGLPVENSLAQSTGSSTMVLLRLTEPRSHQGLSIYMKPGMEPAAVMTVPNGTTPERLAGAFVILDRARKEMQKSKYIHPTDALIRIDVSPVATRKALRPDEMRVYSGYLASFPRASIIDVPGVGTGRAVEIYMPNWPDKKSNP